MVEIFVDGSALGNPGPGGWGFVIEQGGTTIFGAGEAAYATNNEMEVIAVLEALKAVPASAREVVIHTDSQLVIGWLSLGWRCKAAHIRPILAQIQERLKQFETVEFKHESSKAHKLARSAAARASLPQNQI